MTRPQFSSLFLQLDASILSPKLQYLLRSIGEAIDMRKKNIIIFTAGPLTLSHIECFLIYPESHVLCVRNEQNSSERESTRGRFNDKRGPSQILFTSIPITSASVNLQADIETRSSLVSPLLTRICCKRYTASTDSVNVDAALS